MAASASYIVISFEPIAEHINFSIATFVKHNISYRLFEPSFGANDTYDVTRLPSAEAVLQAIDDMRAETGQQGGFVLLFHAAVGEATGAMQIYKGTH